MYIFDRQSIDDNFRLPQSFDCNRWSFVHTDYRIQLFDVEEIEHVDRRILHDLYSNRSYSMLFVERVH
jgi:hypothetical protein